MKVVVTGATGFIGRVVCGELARRGFDVRAATRKAGGEIPGVECMPLGDFGPDTRWEAALASDDAVVHLAGRAHVRGGVSREEHRRVHAINVDATRALASAAAAAGVRRFVFVSTAKVLGEENVDGPWSEQTHAAPEDVYAHSKRTAEQALADLVPVTSLEPVTLRPPLVYGPGVKANFLALMRAIYKGWPLPFASIDNRRSLIYVGNLADAIVRCVESPAAAGKTYLVSDGPAASTPDLCRALGVALGRPARLFRFPVPLLELAPPLRKLTRSLEVDDSAIRRELGWTPPYTFEEGVRATAQWYLKGRRDPRG